MGQGVGVGSAPQFHLQTSSPHAPQRACILYWNGISFTSGGVWRPQKHETILQLPLNSTDQAETFSVSSFDVRGKKYSIWNHNVGQRFPHPFQTLCHLNKNVFLCSWEPNAIRHRHQNLLCCDIDIIGGVTERTVIARSSDLLQTQRVFGDEKVWEVRRPRECKISTHNLSVTATALVL